MMPASVPHRKTTILVATFLLLAAFSALGVARADGAGDIWLVNTRQASHCGKTLADQDLVTFHCSQDACHWSPSSRAEFLATCSSDVPVVVFVHGNRSDNSWAVHEAMDAYRYLKLQAGDKPFRFVIWSWPSELVDKHYRPDVRAKNIRSDAEAFYLADLFQDCSPDVRISLFGYSLGARVIGGGLHLLAGGSVCGRSLGTAPIQRTPMRAVLIAAAIDQDVFSSHGCYSLATTQTDRILITVNRLDPGMKWYVKLYGPHGARALGFAGPTGATAGNSLRTIDLASCVGRCHRWPYYADCSALTSLYGRFAFLCD